jgi:hypothetical protein
MKGAFGNEGALRFFVSNARDTALREAIVQTSQQMGNGLFRFVAHIRKAEGFPFEFAVTGIDDEMMFLAQILR